MHVVTTDEVPGYVVQAALGVAIGTAACTTNRFDAGMKLLEEGDQIDRELRLLRDRVTAVRRMVKQAEAWGANAITGMRFDHRFVTGVWMEICAYGTAVIVQPEQLTADTAGAAPRPA